MASMNERAPHFKRTLLHKWKENGAKFKGTSVTSFEGTHLQKSIWKFVLVKKIIFKSLCFKILTWTH